MEASAPTPLSCPGRSAASPRRCAAEPGPMSPHCTVSPAGYRLGPHPDECGEIASVRQKILCRRFSAAP
ncbi:hypothetical protein CVM73_20625 [Bradyrhizobium forestalis]|uniref:Uncharacterized protein n=1 Tax=Bradyrhizobium forestalis TaxID=1419263 RepID=A0A2M8R672_9BRAD|nr:hypothetical protein CVM73_20625 [Bradyrhizobium forestalis]